MALYPFNDPYPLPSSVHAPALIAPRHVFETDQGVTLRRAKHRRPRRQYQMDYLGITTLHMHMLRDWIQLHHGGVTPFEWLNPRGSDLAFVENTTPIRLSFTHGYITGQQIFVDASSGPVISGVWTVTREGPFSLFLNGSSAAGAGTCTVWAYLPYAIVVLADEMVPAPVKLMGPESTTTTKGRWNQQIVIEEVF